MLKKYLILFLLSLNYALSQESNLQLIDKAKTNLPAKTITKLLVGNWEFAKLTDSTKMNTVKEVVHKTNDTINATEIIQRPSVRINEDGTYEQYNCPTENCESGKWQYDSEEKVLKFKFKEPKYNVPIDRLAPGLLEKLKANGQLIVSEGFEWEIAEINQTELVIIEHLPHNEFEFRYNLRIYQKE